MFNAVRLGCARTDCGKNIRERATCSLDTVTLNEQGQCPWAEELDSRKEVSRKKVPRGKGN